MRQPGLEIYQEQMIVIALICAGIAVTIVVLTILAAIYIKLSRQLCLKELEYRRYFRDEGVFEGDRTELIEEITNHSFLPMFAVDIETHISSKIEMQGYERSDGISQEFISRFFVFPYTRIQRRHTVTCRSRGYYKLETAKVGFAGIEVYLDSPAQIHVYPAEVTVEESRQINRLFQYSAMSKKPLIEDNFSFAGIRQYIPGDAMNALNYKQTARRGELMVNDREYLAGRKLLVYVNFQPNEKKHFPPEQFHELIEKELSYASYLLGESIRNGYVCSFAANSKMMHGGVAPRYAFASGEEYYQELLCQMAEMTDLYAVSMLSVMKQDIEERLGNTEIFLFTPYYDTTLAGAVEDLERNGNVVTVVDVSEE